MGDGHDDDISDEDMLEDNELDVAIAWAYRKLISFGLPSQDDEHGSSMMDILKLYLEGGY